MKIQKNRLMKNSHFKSSAAWFGGSFPLATTNQLHLSSLNVNFGNLGHLGKLLSNTFFKSCDKLSVFVQSITLNSSSRMLNWADIMGDSDVGDNGMLVTLWCWLIWDVGDFFRYLVDFLNVFNRSSTSWIGQQHLKLVTNTFGFQHPSPTSMLPISWLWLDSTVSRFLTDSQPNTAALSYICFQ